MLKTATGKKDKQGIRIFEKAIYDINIQLIQFAKKGSTQELKALLENKVNPNITNKNGFTALFSAVKKGHIEIVAALLAAKAKPDTMVKGWAPLHVAAQYKNTEIVAALLDAKSDPRITNKNGVTPLEIAMKSKHSGVVEAIESYMVQEKQKLSRNTGSSVMLITTKFNSQA